MMPYDSKTINPRDEIVLIVDKDNTEAGTAPRHEMRARGLCHRASYILVFNSRGELFVQKRTMLKDIYPGYYDVAAGGVVLADESYDESARRELHEELGIQNVSLAALFTFYYEEGKNKVWGRVYSCIHDGKLVLQAEEVASGFFAFPEKVLQISAEEPFTPDGLYVLQRYLKEKVSQQGSRGQGLKKIRMH
jgi:isopentenyldiphosphate isomerase